MTKAKQIRACKEANPTHKASDIANACGVTTTYVHQVLYKVKNKAVKLVAPTEGQDTLRKEIKRLNEDLDGWRDLYLSTNEALDQLEQDVVGYRAVISYLQGQLDGVAV